MSHMNNVGQPARLLRSEGSLVRREKCFHDDQARSGLSWTEFLSLFLLLGCVHKTSGKRLSDSTESEGLELIHTHPRLPPLACHGVLLCSSSARLGSAPRASSASADRLGDDSRFKKRKKKNEKKTKHNDSSNISCPRIS